MCGIFSAISLDRPFYKEDLVKFQNATNIIAYRGPDAVGYRTFQVHDNLPGDSYNVFFGHRRLSIIDTTEESNQPMEDDGVTIIFNGEIFNYVELKDELKQLGFKFVTNSDTEVILKIYKHYGSKGFNKLNGMWAFIIYDSNKKLLIASRDRFSIKPLYWLRNGDKLYFASEIKQLKDFLIHLKFNKRTINQFLLQGLMDFSPETFFDGIERLDAKSNMIVNFVTGEISSECYWDYNIISIPENQIYEKFLELLFDSVKIRLRSDVELGALLSGGLDSSAISIAARTMVGENFRSFTVVSDDQKSNEEIFADIVTQSKSIKNKKLLLNSSTIKDNFENVLYHQDEPFAGFSVIAQYSILEKIKKETDITVVLSGQGGDEVLLGYLRYFFFYLRYLNQNKKYFELTKEIIASIINRTMIMQLQLSTAKRYLPNAIMRDKDFLINSPELVKNWGHSNLIESQKNDLDKYSIPILARYEDHNSMAHSIETRLPFLDHRLVEFLLGIDIKFKVKNGWNKYILRKSFNLMPNKIRWRRDKKGFTVPEEHWLKFDFKDDIIGHFKKSKLEEAGIIRGDLFINYFQNYLSGNRRIHYSDISRIYITEKWMKKYFN